MHLVFLNQYYPPDDAPTGRMLEGVVGHLLRDGHQVTVVCSKSGGYAGAGDPAAIDPATDNGPGCRVIRVGATGFGRRSVPGKLVDYASFYLSAARRLETLKPRPDRIVAMTTPPYLSVLARLVSKFRGADHAHWVMDLYPDVMVAHGMLRELGMGHRVLAWLARWGFGGRRNAGILALGPDMKDRIGRLSATPRIDWVPLWPTANAPPEDLAALDADARAMRLARGWNDDELVLMYSGNMGLGHRFGEFLAAASETGPGVRWSFHGGGRRRAEVEAFVRDRPGLPVELHGYVAHRDLAAHLRTADVHLTSLEPTWDGTMVPSKLQGIAAAGRPVIFIGTASSSIGRWVLESGAGWVVPPGNVGELLGAIHQAKEPAQRERRGRAAAALAGRLFRPDRNIVATAEFLTGD